ncbi:BlaI/MecI/CopY family transcriptional regulator [Mucilaginibacter sp. RS28]|uniref:BlaI/MecI/CopY family transcriptional regulator n=1 Tax=Mucilaginibacter straminoryzae TaxID=2932774 RepID=A0A9X1X3P0_9SPHI|nr:BlaI/MecI/CopY family transcriptional regulator [Mucilaginibacter straminoryzae]MCJ8209961.1 BlaI/MecI/CopY family transcriptional regulator [Mucilaginibacter straminoryzae]
MKELTKAEEQVMQILWQIKEGVVKDVLAKMPDPKPAYNTVSTVVRVMETKGFLGHKAFGNTHVYHPLITEADYKKFVFDGMMKTWFNNSVKDLVTYLAKEGKLDITDLAELILLSQKAKK